MTPIIESGTDITLSQADLLAGDLFINPSAGINVDLPDASEGLIGRPPRIYHIGGANTLTIRLPSAATLVSLAAGERAEIAVYMDSSGVPQYVTFQSYTPTNVTTDRAFDADAVLIAELADVVGTLIADLKVKGIID